MEVDVEHRRGHQRQEEFASRSASRRSAGNAIARCGSSSVSCSSRCSSSSAGHSAGRASHPNAIARSSSAVATGCSGAMISATRDTVASIHTASPASQRAITVRSPNSSVRPEDTSATLGLDPLLVQLRVGLDDLGLRHGQHAAARLRGDRSGRPHHRRPASRPAAGAAPSSRPCARSRPRHDPHGTPPRSAAAGTPGPAGPPAHWSWHRHRCPGPARSRPGRSPAPAVFPRLRPRPARPRTTGPDAGRTARAPRADPPSAAPPTCPVSPGPRPRAADDDAFRGCVLSALPVHTRRGVTEHGRPSGTARVASGKSPEEREGTS